MDIVDDRRPELPQRTERRFAGYDDQMLIFDLKLNNRMAALQGYVSTGDYPPTDQQLAVFEELSAMINTQLARLKQSLDVDLPALNSLARAAGLEGISHEGR